MFNVKDYFKKFTSIEGSVIASRDIVFAALKEVCDIEGVDFDIKKGIVIIKGSPVAKSIIFTKKDALLSNIKANPVTSKIRDIK